ncbi:MAG: hypothetical protein AAF138_07255 [Planctomycetota bacterium]
MLRSLANIFESGGEFVTEQAKLAATDLQRSAARSAAVALGVFVAGVGALTLLAGVGVLIAHVWGLAASLIILGATLLVFAGGAVGLVIASRKRAQERSEAIRIENAERARARMLAEAKPPLLAPAPHSRPRAQTYHQQPEDHDMLDSMKKAAIENPALAASAAFALLSLLGPGRAVKLAARGATALSLAASLKEAANATQDGATAVQQGPKAPH